MNRLADRYAPYPLLEPRLDGWLLSAEWKPPPGAGPAPLFVWCAAGVVPALGGDAGLWLAAFRLIIMSVVGAPLPWPCVSRICESSSCSSACTAKQIEKKN